MADAASLLAWGRSIVAAKRGGVSGGDGGAAGGSPAASAAAPASRRQPSLVHGKAVGSRVGGGTSAEDGGLYEQPPNAPRAALQSLHRPSTAFGNDLDDRSIAAPTEAREKHWQWLDRFEHSAASTPLSSASGGGGHRGGGGVSLAGAASESTAAPRGGNACSQPSRGATAASGAMRRRSMTVTGSSPTPMSQLATPQRLHEAPSSSHTDLMLKHDEEMLRRRVEAEKKHVAELITMRDRNFTEFSTREAELLAELDALPRILEEAENRRTARLSSSTEYVHERDLTAMEEILWSLESRMHDVTAEEEKFGLAVTQCAECAECSEAMAIEVRELVPFALCRSLRRLGPTLLELRAYTQHAPRMSLQGERASHGKTTPPPPGLVVDNDSIPGLVTKVPDDKELRERFQRVAEGLGRSEPPRASDDDGSKGDTTTSRVDSIPPDQLFAAIAQVVVGAVEPFLRDVTHVADTLRHARMERLAAVTESLTEADTQVNVQKVTMDEAHAALNEMVQQLDAIAEHTGAVDARIVSVEDSLQETKQHGHEGVERVAELSARKMALENEMRELKEQIAASKREFGQLQLTERKHNKVSEAHNQRCEALREEARAAARSQLEALEGEVSQLQRACRTTTSANEQLAFDAQKLNEKVDASKQRLQAAQEKLLAVQRRCEAHEGEREKGTRARNEIQRSVDEADRLFQSLELSMDHLRQDTVACSDDVFAASTQLHTLRDDNAVATDRLQDALEELELVRAVLLHQETTTRRAGGGGGSATASQRTVDEDQKLLHMGSPAADKRTSSGLHGTLASEAEPEPRLATTSFGNPEGHSTRSRSKQWRSSSRSSEPSPSAHTSAMHPPDELETVAPPPAWSRMTMHDTGSAAPLLVAPHPRNYQRERNALLATHEKSRQALVDYLESSDHYNTDEEEGETASSGVDELHAAVGRHHEQRPQRSTVHHGSAGLVAHADARRPHTKGQWEAAPPHIVYDAHERGSHYGRGGGADDARSSSAFSSAPPSEVASEYEPPFAAGTGRAAYSNRSTPNSGWHTRAAREVDAERLSQQRQQEEAQQQALHRAAGGSVPSKGLPLHSDKGGNAPTSTSTTPSSRLQDRLMHVKAKLHRAVADHSTAHAKKPFR